VLLRGLGELGFGKAGKAWWASSALAGLGRSWIMVGGFAAFMEMVMT